MERAECARLFGWACARVWQQASTLIAHTGWLHYPAQWKQSAVYGNQAHRSGSSKKVNDCHPQKHSNHTAALIAYALEEPPSYLIWLLLFLTILFYFILYTFSVLTGCLLTAQSRLIYGHIWRLIWKSTWAGQKDWNHSDVRMSLRFWKRLSS